MKIILIRHGETTWNIEGRYQGQEDTPLSERGLRQGQLLAEALHKIHLDVCTFARQHFIQTQKLSLQLLFGGTGVVKKIRGFQRRQGGRAVIDQILFHIDKLPLPTKSQNMGLARSQ